MKQNKIISTTLCLLLTTAISFGVTGCSKKDDATGDTASVTAVEEDKSNQTLFVQAYMDLLCQQDFEGYASACGFETSEVEDAYPDLLDNVIDIFLTYQMSDTEQENFRDELKKIFNKCQYEVKDAIENDDNSYTVPVEVKKLKVFSKAIKKADKSYKKWAKKQSDDKDEQDMTDKFIEYVIKYCEEELENPQYKDVKTVNVVLSPSSDDANVYEYNSEDLGSLQAALVDFGAWERDVDDADDVTES